MVLIKEADVKSINGDYLGALHSAQRALVIAKNTEKNEGLSSLRTAYAKLHCVLKMRQFPEYFDTATEYISDILTLGVFDKCPTKMFMLYFELADISVSNNRLPAARAAMEKAYSWVQNDYDNIRCDSLKGIIAMQEGEFDKAITLLQNIVDVLNFKILTREYANDREHYMLEQNLASTLNNIAIAYHSSNNLELAMIYVKQAVNAAQGSRLEFERAIFLIHWADMLYNAELFDSAIEKATVARDIFKTRNEMSYFLRACKILGKTYYRQKNLILSRKMYIEALDCSQSINDKLFFSQMVAEISAELGDEQSLNKQIAFIEKLDTFSDRSAFESWVKSLQLICRHILPDDLKDKKESFFMYDEADTDFIQIKNDILNIKNSSHSIVEYDTKIKEYLIQLSGKSSKIEKKNFSHEKQLKILLSKMGDSESLREKAQLMYEVGCCYYRQQKCDEADIWFLKAMNAIEASEHTVVWAKISHAQVLMNNGTMADDEQAKTILDEVWRLLGSSTNYEAIAFCQFNRGRLEARKGEFEQAIRLFQHSYKALRNGNIKNPSLIQEIEKRYSSVAEYLSFEDNPTEDIHLLQSELMYLQTWYPEYSQQLTEYWWYYRGKEPLSNVRISSTSACVIFSDDKREICWFSEALRSLFSHCLFAPKESWENIDHSVTRTIPVPCNTPFPYSTLMVYDKKIDGKVYGHHLQIDGSERRYAYVRIQDEKFFDKKRYPEPITLSFLGYCYPEIVHEIAPMTDEFGSSRWWIGAEFGGSPDGLINLASRFGIIPVFHLEDLNAKNEITILQSERINVPFISDDNNLVERKHIQKDLRRMTSIWDQSVLFSEFDKVIERIGALPQEGLPIVSVHLAIVRFGYRKWSESPIHWRMYPVVLIYPEDACRNQEIDNVISKSIATRDAIYLVRRMAIYAHHTYSLDESYIREDASKLLKLSVYIGDEDMLKIAQSILKAIDHC